jgi:agmatinase
VGRSAPILDAGDLEFQTADSHFEEIESSIALLLENHLSPISLGGDHAITYPIIKAFRKNYSHLSILHFDAHPDLYDELLGNRFSHACPFARIMEAGLADRLVQVGIRTLNAHQKAQAERFGVEVHEMKDWQGFLDLEFDSPLYITVDLDGLDPAFAPGVSHHEPGGLSTRDVIRVIHAVKAPAIIGADIVELNPTRDVHGVTAMVAAKFLKEIAAKMLLSGNT